MSTKRICEEELQFDARLQEHIDKRRAKWEADDMRNGKPPSERTIGERLLWEAMIEETEWEKFYGVEELK